MDYRVPHYLVVSSFQNLLTQKQSPAFQRSRTVYHHDRRTSVPIHKRTQLVKQTHLMSKDTLTNSLNTRSYQKRFEEQKNGLQGAPLSSCFLFSKFADSKAESCVSEITNGLPSRSTYISTDTKNELNR